MNIANNLTNAIQYGLTMAKTSFVFSSFGTGIPQGGSGVRRLIRKASKAPLRGAAVKQNT